MVLPFPEKLRKWYIRAVGNQSVAHTYDEKRGFVRSKVTENLHVHHIDEEAKLLEDGSLDPNHADALVLGRNEHVGHGVIYDRKTNQKRIAHPFEKGHSFHPEMGKARVLYRRGDKQAFKKAAREYQKRAKSGEDISNSDRGANDFYRAQMKRLTDKYQREHPEDPKPKVKSHKNFKKKHWWDEFFGK